MDINKVVLYEDEVDDLITDTDIIKLYERENLVEFNLNIVAFRFIVFCRPSDEFNPNLLATNVNDDPANYFTHFEITLSNSKYFEGSFWDYKDKILNH